MLFSLLKCNTGRKKFEGTGIFGKDSGAAGAGQTVITFILRLYIKWTELLHSLVF